MDIPLERLNIRLGVASSATQIEGGDLGHDWNDWYGKGKIKDGSNPARANNHHALWREDIALMKELGIPAYRLGVEWARLEPAEGETNPEAVAYYRALLEALREAGIAPLLTIHHFTVPGWFARKGGFARRENISLFLRFVERIVDHFGDLVSEYITVNEPNVYAVHSYWYGLWPPGEKSFFRAFSVMSNLTACHIQAYELIHRLRREKGFDAGEDSRTKVGFAHHVRVFAPENPGNPLHRLFAAGAKYFFQGALTTACCTGRFRWPLKNPAGILPGEYCDFHAVNYYSRSTVRGLKDGVRAGAPVNDLNWEIYPQGIAECAAALYAVLPRPVYITENGTCDNADAFRCRYIYEHLAALHQSGLPVERYYHWCFCDNFEWLEGEWARFGLVHVDYETQRRTVKKSGRFYAEINQKGGVTQDMLDRYVAGEHYNINH